MRKRLQPRRSHLTMALVARRAPIGEAGRSNVWVRFARPLHLPAIGWTTEDTESTEVSHRCTPINTDATDCLGSTTEGFYDTALNEAGDV